MLPLVSFVAIIAAIEVAPQPRPVNPPPRLGIPHGEVPREVSPAPKVPTVPVDKE